MRLTKKQPGGILVWGRGKGVGLYLIVKSWIGREEFNGYLAKAWKSKAKAKGLKL